MKSRSQIKKELVKRLGFSEYNSPNVSCWDLSLPTEIGRKVPIPKQARDFHFIEYRPKDAKILRRELKKLIGKPVVLTGGGGAGMKLAFLEDVVIECEKKAPHRGVWDGYRTIYLQSGKEKEICSVRAKLKGFDGKKFDPYVASWRITALKGYGAEKLSKKKLYGWER